MKQKTVIFLILIMAAFGIRVFADVEIKAKIDKKRIPINENARLTVSIYGTQQGNITPEIPKIDGFRVYGSGTSQNISIVNGRMRAYYTNIYTLVPKTMGKFRIPAISVKQGGKVYKTDPIDVEVIKATAVRVSQSKEELEVPEEGAETIEDERYRGAVFVTADVDEDVAYIDEQITYSFRFYRKVNLLKRPDYKPPTTEGFWVEDLPPERVFYQYINGERYLVSEIKMALFPTSTGKLQIGPAEIQCVIPGARKKIKRRDPFDMFDEDPFSIFGGDPFEMMRGRSVSLSTDPISIKVLPLPSEGRPQGFTGMVGSFTFKVDVTPRKVEVNQPVTLRIEVSGQGNLKTLPEPDLGKITGFKIYDSGSSVDITKDDFIIGGKKVFEKVLVPQEPGVKEIPELSFSYFDPFKKEYKSIVSKPVEITVTPATEKEEKVIPFIPQVGQHDITLVKKDIHHIRTKNVRFSNKRLPVASLVIYSNIIPLVLFLIVGGITLNKMRQTKNVEYFRTRKAHGLAKKRLGDARKLLKAENAEKFYQSIAVSLRQYLADKIGISAAGMRFAEVEKKLRSLHIDETLLKDLKRSMESADMVRFTSVTIETDRMKKDLKHAEDIMVKLERLKWNNGK